MKLRLLILIFFSSALQASEPQRGSSPEEIKKQLGTRSLIIIFDPAGQEKNIAQFEAMTSKLYTALHYSKTSIIITSKTLWENIETYFSKPTKYAHRTDKPIDKSKWHINWSQDESLLILIPNEEPFNSYLKEVNSFVAGGKSNNISDGELLLGIKVNNLFNKSFLQSSLNTLKKYLPIINDDLKAYLQEILITYGDLTDLGQDYMNTWDIYLTGHGGLGSGIACNRVAGMKSSLFGLLLDFLNNRINTRTLLYSTCGAGGKNLEVPYEYETVGEIRAKELNFLIIASTVLEYSVGFVPNISDFFINGFKKIDNYFESIDALYKNRWDAGALYKVINATLMPDMFTEAHRRGDEVEVMGIRLPKKGKFNIVNSGNKIFELNDNLIARTINGNNNKIGIPKDAGTMLLESRYIPISLVLGKDQLLPLFVPKKNGVPYFFKDIDLSESEVDLSCEVYFFGERYLYTSFEQMLSNLKTKAPRAGKIYIETLKIKKVTNQRTQQGTLNWGSGPFEFKEVIMDPDVSISLKYKNEPFTYTLGWTKKYWQTGLPASSDFTRGKEAALKESMLPESMKGEAPQPSVTLSLWHEYLKRKNKPQELATWRVTLTNEQQNIIDKFEKNEDYEDFGDLPELE